MRFPLNPANWSRRRLIVALAALALGAGAVIAFFVLRDSTGDVHRGDEVEFTTPQKSKPKETTLDWPFYHRDLAHTGFLPKRVPPPYRTKWVWGGKILMEFPPIIIDQTLYYIRNNAQAFARDAKSGRLEWKKRIGDLAASSPAFWNGNVYFATLTGKLVALRAEDGRTRWEKSVGSRTESSPIVSRGTIYFGSESGTLYALRAKNGHIKWTYHAAAAIKASPALANGILYFGDYSGRMYAVWARNGRERWSKGTSGLRLGLSAGNFYSTPAVAFGRVYAGNTDGKVYSFSARSGELAWSKSTGGYVYSSPAAADAAGTQPSVYVGSYDGNLYALDARTGAVRWTAAAGGRISGGPTVVGDIVFVANIDSKNTYGFGVRNGTRRFHFRRGAYNPVVSDGSRIYLVGYGSVTALEPRKRR